MVQEMTEELMHQRSGSSERVEFPLSPLSDSQPQRLGNEDSSVDMSDDGANSSSESVSVDTSDDESQAASSSSHQILHSDDLSGQNLQNSAGSVDSGSTVIVPRTVPCIVLTPPTIFNPGLPLVRISPVPGKLHGFTGSAESVDRLPASDHFLYGNRSSVTQFGGGKSKGENSLNLTISHRKDEDKVGIKAYQGEVQSKKLAFGIDRILAEENEGIGLNLMKTGSTKPRSGLGHPVEFNLKSYHNHSEDHHHQGSAENYASQCSECFFLSRYCRRIQFPLSTPTSASSSFSWIPSPSASHSTDATSSLMSTNGFGQHQHVNLPYGMSNSNFSSISPMVSCNSSGNGRRKRSWSRAVFSNLQRKGLEKRFQLQKYITKPDRRQLAATLGLTDAQVKVWFQNRRMKWRHSKEGKQGAHAATEESTSDKK